MPAISAPDLAKLRGQRHVTDLFMTVNNPTTLWTALINDGAIVRNQTTIAFDNGSGLDFTAIEALQEVWVGTAAGARDIGRLRIRSISSSDGGVTGTLTVARHDLILANNYYLTFKHDYPFKPKFPFIDGAGTFYKDGDIGWSNQTVHPEPVLIAGPHQGGFIQVATGYFEITSQLPDSYDVDPAATITSYSATCYPSAGVTININAGTGVGTIRFTNPGPYWVKYSITNDQGKTQIGYRFYYAHELDPNSVHYPYRNFNINALAGSWDRGGYSCGVKMRDNVPETAIPDEALVIIWQRPEYDGLVKNITLLPSNMKPVMVGYVSREDVSTEWGTGVQTTDFNVETIDALIKAQYMFSVSLASTNSPSAWFEFPSWLYIGAALHHLYHWHSNLLQICDFLGLADNQDKRAYAEFEDGNLFAMGNGMAKDRGIRAQVVADKAGRLHLTPDIQLLTDAERAPLTIIQKIELADLSGEVSLQVERTNSTAFVKTSGFYFDGTYTADGPNALPFCASAPGVLPDDEGSNVVDQERQILRGQQHCNELAGRMFAKINNPYPTITFNFNGNYFPVLDIAYGEIWTVDLTIPYTNRDIVLTDHPLYCRDLSTSYENGKGIMITSATFELEAAGFEGQPGFCLDDLPADHGDPPEIDEDTGAGALITASSVYYKPSQATDWSLRTAEATNDLIEDPHWPDKVGSDQSTLAIVWRCGSGYVKRSTDAGVTWSTVTPGNDPPNTWSDTPAPTATTVEYEMLEGNVGFQDEFAVIANFQNGASEWRAWVAYTTDNGTTWVWTPLSSGSANSIDSYGTRSSFVEIANGIELVSEPSPPGSPKAIIKIGANKVAAVYSKVGSGGGPFGELFARVATISSGVLTWGTEIKITTDEARGHRAVALNDANERFVVFWTNNTGSPKILKSQVCSVSGTTITLTLSQSITSVQAFYADACLMDAPAGRLVVQYRDDAVNQNKVRVMAIGPTAITLGTEYSWSASGHSTLAVGSLNSTTFCIAYRNATDSNKGYAVIGQTAGDIISTVGTGYKFADAEIIYGTVLGMSSSQVLISYARGVSWNGAHTCAGTVSGTVITFGTEVAAASGSSFASPQAAKFNSSNFLIAYTNTTGTKQVSHRIGTVSGNAISYGTQSTNSNTSGQNPSEVSVCILDAGTGVVVYERNAGTPATVGGDAYTVNVTLGSGEARALGVAVSKGINADSIWVTAHKSPYLYLLEYDLALVLVQQINLGEASESQVNTRTYIAWPYAEMGTDSVVYVFGKMLSPQGLTGAQQVIVSDDYGATWSEVPADFLDTNYVGAFILDQDGVMAAVMCAGNISKLYRGNNTLELTQTLPFNAYVNPHNLKGDWYSADLFVAAGVANQIMVVRVKPPYADINTTDITYDHGNAAGINALEVL